MQFVQLLQILRARSRLGWPIFAACVGFAVLASLVLPKRYTATAVVIVDARSPEILNAAANAQVTQSNGFMVTQAEVLRSERVALAAVDLLKLKDAASVRERWLAATEGKGDFAAWIAAYLQKRTTVAPSREGNTIKVEFSSADAQQAAAVANAIVQAFMDTTAELKAEPQREYKGFFDERAKSLRSNLEAAQTKLSNYQRRNGILASEERFDIETTRLNELSSQLVALQGMASETSSRQAFADSDRDRLQEVLNNPVVSALTADISRAQARLSELTARLGEAHPSVIDARASVAELKRRVAAESARVSGSVGTNAAINQKRLGQLQQALAEQRAKVLRLREQRDDISVLQRDVANAQRAYELVLVRASETGLESQGHQTNVSWLQKATMPISPSSPRWGLNLGLGSLAGAVLAILAMLLVEIKDRRLRSADDVIHAVELAVLGVMPARPVVRNRPPARLGLRPSSAS